MNQAITQHHHHDHDHQHGSSWWRSLGEALHLPGFNHDHDHDTAKVVALTGSASHLGIRTIWWSLLLLGLTTVIQVVIYWLSGSVALLGDTVHNFGDALNTLPLLVAFMLARRAATSRYRYGFGRAEDLAGLAIVASMAISAIYIGIEAWQKLLNPTQITQLPWVIAAAIIGFFGNYAVAYLEIRTGKKINSAALIADGKHAQIDALTSLAVLGAAAGAWLGWSLLDPLIGLLMTIIIAGMTWQTARTIWQRLMDAVDPHLIAHVEEAVGSVAEVQSVQQLRARWLGHQLLVDLTVQVVAERSIAETAILRQQLHAQVEQVVQRPVELSVQFMPAK
ncbi:cation diffusion facilitator family transporter [Herpetosiphon gulosus]|uniref:Cation efflux system protein Rv2025c n=1 Tax=Herpetosiphon gulosus TaxID=1973496 RepID=A0ABP9WXZ9_9CHLR